MKVSQRERETLTGPAAVGIVVGIFCAVFTVAFDSDYGEALASGWSTTCDAILSLVAGFALAFVPFGLVPVLVGRVRSGAGNKGG
ncbi:hypothetical protein ACEN88_25890 [Massilia sp. CT11-108]|uniref:hypothetical protein n=1 Tax=Massilia sp. CT11-108 TaxID=3393900 RepID=UPI0039A57098